MNTQPKHDSPEEFASSINCRVCVLKEDRIEVMKHHIDRLQFRIDQQLPPVSLKIAKEQVEQIKIKQEALAKELERREEFIAFASHELRTPLTSMKLATQIARVSFKAGKLTPERIEKFLETSLGQINKMVNLVQELLSDSAINSGENIKIKPEHVNLSELIKEVVGRFPSKKITLHCTNQVEGEFDRFRVDQVVTNLLTNAIKYGKGNPIAVRLKHKDNCVVLQVVDHGEGIAGHNLNAIFERFKRVTRDEKIAGLGLGLYIVKQIVEAQGGTITVDSELGKGSIFTVRWPLGVGDGKANGVAVH